MDRSQYTIYPPTLTDTTGDFTGQRFRSRESIIVDPILPPEAFTALRDRRYTIRGDFLTFDSDALPPTHKTEYAVSWLLGVFADMALRSSRP